MKIAHKHFTGAVASALAVVALPFVLPASAASDAETKGLAIVKQFTVDHNERLIAQAKLLND